MFHLHAVRLSGSGNAIPSQNPPPCFRRFVGGCLLSPGRTCRLPFHRRSSRKLSLLCRQSDFYEPRQRYGAVANNSDAPPGTGGTSSTKVFVGHSIYKGKAALTVEPRAPEFTSLDSGAYKLLREGFVLLQFAPAAGVRSYDWSRKQVFSLSVTEIATIIGLGARDSCEFFHDPFKGKGDEGKIRKVLKVEPLPDGSGHFFNLSVQNKMVNMDESIYIPVTKAELTVLVSAFNFIMPYLLGWHAYAETIKPEDTQRTKNANPRILTTEANKLEDFKSDFMTTQSSVNNLYLKAT